MRFVAGGPWLPDTLLDARDAGQVLFFCGAGISQAEARLPNFADLAENVLGLLGSALDSPARRLFQASQAFEKASGLTGLVATDRIFGMLEREFEPEEVREAVAIALRPEPGHGLGAHRTVLDLSRTRAGVARLVTTNFDLLFEECDPTLRAWNPPHLPDPARQLDFRGIIHLHGRVDDGYARACDDEFVLSSADFGRAYLADGWATRYIQSLLQRFKIVFLGYSADDPPVQYLLEALSRSDTRPNALYAFQAGDVTQAADQWEHKGVRPLAYDSANRHAALWDTLRAWADRARDVDGWYGRVIAAGSAGPAKVAPFERGILAHVASGRIGARHLATAPEPLPASWLNVLDPKMRYGDVGKIDLYDEASARFDPFEAYGLDSDEPPALTDPDDRFARRPMPKGAWDGFASTELDRTGLDAEAAGQLRGNDAPGAASLAPRLWQLGVYLTRVAHQPDALWWAAHQKGLHPHILRHLTWVLRHEAVRFSAPVRDGWRALLASWDDRRLDPDQLRFDIDARVKADGWSSARVRDIAAMYRPKLEVEPAFGVTAPEARADLKLGDILRVSVEYPRPHEPLFIPPDQLPYAADLLGAALAHGLVLEREVRGRDHAYFDTIRPDDGGQLSEDAFKLTGLLVTYTNLLARLIETDRSAARAKIANWPDDDAGVFALLRIWAASRAAAYDGTEAGEMLCALSEEHFWSHQHERDLLFALRDRWADLPEPWRQRIEHRILTGQYPWPEPRDDEAAANAHYRLMRLQWLHNRGVRFGFDFDAVIAGLRQAAPEWEPAFAAHAARARVGEVYHVKTDTDPSALEDLPLPDILEAVDAAAGQRDFFEQRIDRQPFRGLAESRPVRAMGVLTDAQRRGQFHPQAWTAMLYAGGLATTSDRLLTLIGHRIARLTSDQRADLAHPISEWLRDRGEKLQTDFPAIFELVWNALASALAAHPLPSKFRRADASWVDDGLNMPAGRMVDALLKDPAKTGFRQDGGLPERWVLQLDQLLALPGDHRFHAIVMISPHLNWLYNIDPTWTERQLVVLAERGGDDATAFWGGYFWGARTPQLPLYQRLKPSFVALARDGTKRRDHANKLAGMLLAGWGGAEDADPERLVPDVELREILIHSDDELRTQLLGYLERWSREPDSRWGARIIPFLEKVWPRQRAVRTPRVSSRLADLALASPERFVEIVTTIRPWLKSIKGAGLRAGPFLDGENGLAARHPAAMLDLLWAILAEDPIQWPYETGKILDILAQADATAGDQRLAELRRRQVLL